jgi:hypothetical protein
MKTLPRAHDVNEWFPLAQQKIYVETLRGQFRLTRKQATCFVRLWGYAQLQQSEKELPIHSLNQQIDSFSCSQKEAAELFYCDQDRGGERSAGMMIDTLVARHLVKREPFDGGATRLELNILDSFLPRSPLAQNTQLYSDNFNVRNDAARIAAFLAETYSWVDQRPEAMSFKIVKVLRQWATQCPHGLRVLRSDLADEPVGFSVLFPVHADSEENFHLPPSGSVHLSTLAPEDPIKVAQPGDAACYAVFIRSWDITRPHWHYASVCQFLQDSQATLKQMQHSFPNLCDLYSITIHPRLAALALALGFKPMMADPNTSLRWIHLPLDKFLALDIDAVLVDFDFSSI